MKRQIKYGWPRVPEDFEKHGNPIFGKIKGFGKEKGKFGEQEYMLLELPEGEVLQIGLNRTRENHLINKFGDDDDKWIGQKIGYKWTVTQKGENEYSFT